MPSVNKEQIAKAKEIDLLTYLQAREPEELIRSGPNEYRTKSHHSLVISNGMWHWVNGNVGGKTALDYLIHVRGYSFVEAVTTLCGSNVAHNISFQSVKNNTKTEKTQFILPPRNNNNDCVIAYLRSRGIDGDIIADCIRRGDLYESVKSRNCVFVGRDLQGIPRFASIRGTFNNYKQDVAGSRKQYGFCLSQKPDSRIVRAFESPVDVLSVATLAKKSAESWESSHLLSLSGTSPLSLFQFLKDRPEINNVVLSLDNDHAGRNGTQRIVEAIRNDAFFSRQVTGITDKPPNQGFDYNDQLQQFLRAQERISAPSRHRQAVVSFLSK